MKKPTNPFLISGYQGNAYFCNRKPETKELISAIENGRNLTLLSLRRMGKTGLIRHSFQQLDAKKYNVLYVDLLHTTDQPSFVRAFAKAAINQLSIGVLKTSIQKIAMLFNSVRPTFTVDPISGMPSVEINIQRKNESEKTLEEIFSLLEKHPVKVAVAFDEFQMIANYPEKNTEALLRSHIQHLNNVIFIYSGSQKHILSNMFGDAKRPFYHSSQNMTLESIGKKEYSQFIQNHFNKAQLEIANNDIEFILDWTYFHTFYVQYFCNRFFDLKRMTSDATVYHTIEKIFSENESVFANYRTLLTPPQLKLLTAIAKEEIISRPMSKNFLSTHHLTSSGVQRTLPALIQKEFLTHEKEGYRVYDVFFGRWLAAKF